MRHLVVLLFLSACEGLEGGEGQNTDTSSGGGACTSDSYYHGDEESSAMHPGLDCIGCHQSDEGPAYTAAGTVYTGLDEPDDCNGLRGVTVEIIDGDGTVHTAVTNSAGNFAFSERIPTPYTARVFDTSGFESVMAGHQTSGACNTCHTAAGTGGAPGRISL